MGYVARPHNKVVVTYNLFMQLILKEELPNRRVYYQKFEFQK